MSTTHERSAVQDGAGVLVGAIAVLVALACGAVSAAAHLANARLAVPEDLTGNPVELALRLLTGAEPWPAGGVQLLVLIGAGAALLLAVVATAVVRRRRRRSRVDVAASRMGRGREVAARTDRGARRTAGRLGVASPGVPVGRTVEGDRTVYAGWEDVTVDIWGPRTGKTTSRAIPAILAAPGAVLATSNKRDLVDATRDLRAGSGSVWVFDPQGVADEPQTWWWDPLAAVTDAVGGARLAEVLTTAGRQPGAHTDAYFDSAGRDLLAGLLLAAACDRRPLIDVYLWLTDPSDDEPVAILAEHGQRIPSAAVAGVVNAPEKQRAGVYGTALQTVSFMTDDRAMRWVTPPVADRSNPWLATAVPAFVPAEFVASSDTLYSLSREGHGSAGPLVTALTVAVAEAAEALATRSAGGRLPVPLLAVLDEAANVCRWRDLPALYSHYGSRGICLMTILQSWSQGVSVWGEDGMQTLWSAATVKVYGGGVSDAGFLEQLSQLVGDYDRRTRSRSHGRDHTSRSHATTRERILDVAALSSLPRGRALMITSGSRPALIRTTPWMEGPHAVAVSVSIARHDPASGSAATRRRLDATAGSRRRGEGDVDG